VGATLKYPVECSCSGAQALLHMLPGQGLLASTTCVSGMIIDPVACSCIARDRLLSSQPGPAVMQATELVSGQAQPSTRAAQVWLQHCLARAVPCSLPHTDPYDVYMMGCRPAGILLWWPHCC
jgi:hypothetical protein